jgi:DnaJ like chaperone protein
VGENHVIRFLADALGVNQQQFTLSFQSVTGRAPQDPSDLSRATWWDERDRLREEKRDRDRAQHEQEQRRSSQRNQSSSQRRTRSSTTPLPISGSRRSEALRYLGLGPEATMEEIKEAYKRLAKVHHPDRFEGLSVEIIEAASLSFRRIRTAYEDLNS